MTKPIPPLDLMWLVMETQASPTHVGAMLLFEKPKGSPHVVRRDRRGLPVRRADATRSITFRNSAAPACLYFREAASYDPRLPRPHLALPEGATYEDLLRLVADLHEPMLDRGRPLFRDWLIDGVQGNRFAVYAKVHHAIIDGASGTKRLYASLSPSPRRVIPTARVRDAQVPVRKPRPPKAARRPAGGTRRHRDEADARAQGRLARRAQEGARHTAGRGPGRQRSRSRRSMRR